MWLEEVRSAWVPTQELILLIGGTAFAAGLLFSEPWCIVVVTILSHCLVWCEDQNYEDEIRSDRAVFWRSLAFQIVVMMCSALCWVFGRAIQAFWQCV
mmetsp:Transcript_32888/g.48661  ORF Transcript_32888/g.48661 Transcript_32888/m.48661 type:complete len:98 (-) Transcript_32888:423-716(-)